MISEAAAGRFTFVSMLASLSYIAQKSVVEPIYYPRLIRARRTEDTYREFRSVNLTVIVGATLCSVLGLAASAWINGVVPPVSELVSFGLLCLAFACLSLAQPAHYRLYRWHRDRAIMTTGSIAGMPRDGPFVHCGDVVVGYRRGCRRRAVRHAGPAGWKRSRRQG